MIKKLTTLILLLLFAQCLFAEAKTKVEVEPKKQVFYLNIDWWDEFNNPQLHDYLIKVFENNHDLKIVNLNIKKGEEAVKQSIANELPQIGLSSQVERTIRSSEEHFGADMVIPNFAQTNLLFPITANYELDIWGLNHTKTKSVKKQLEVIQEYERAQYIAITGNFASTYYNLVKCDKLLKLQNELVVLQKNLLELVNIKFESGKCSVVEVIEQKKLLKNLEEEQHVLNKERKMLEEDLKVAIADPEMKNIEDTSLVEIPFISFPTQVPSDVIEIRPDVLMAEKTLEKMGLDVKVAKKNLLPKFVIFGQIGLNAYQLGNLFNTNSLLSSVGVAPIIDIFTGGKKLSYLRYRKYEYEEALENYKKIILISYKEVNDALVLVKTNKENFESADERYKLEKENYFIAKSKYEGGYDTKLRVIQAKEAELFVEKEKINFQTNTLISLIGLYKSVGGKNLGEIKEAT